ncbi:transposase [Celeribacter sp.]|uniref:transposase n=1 Tax=Celeribacter sp. TaxID=1890673 RepID=UPI003A8EC2C4
MQLFLRLPHGGVGLRFPDAAACEQRVREVRWPDGMRCLECGNGKIKTCITRKTYRCRDCGHEFSLEA